MNTQVQHAASTAVKDAQDPLADNFFTPVANTKPYFKAGIQGLAGTGKTYTAAQIAIGLHKRIGSKKPIVMFDTEKASKFLKAIFAEAGIELMVRDSRTLADLKKTMEKLRDGYSDILIIDSISHVWEDTVESFKKKYNRSSLQFQDWGVLKPLWKQEFSDPLVRLPFSIIMCGRAGYEYENEINESTGKREIYKSGIKMKVEGDTAYEHDVLVLMERFEAVMCKAKKIEVLEKVFNTRSWLAVESKWLAELKGGLEKIKVLVNDELAEQFPDKAAETEAAKSMKKGIEKSKKESKK